MVMVTVVVVVVVVVVFIVIMVCMYVCMYERIYNVLNSNSLSSHKCARRPNQKRCVFSLLQNKVNKSVGSRSDRCYLG